jgi:hypothetical protein
MTQKKILWGIFLVVIVSISGVLGNGGLWQAYKLRQAAIVLDQRVQGLIVERDQLRAVYSTGYGSSQVLEVVVRDTIGFVRPNDMVFEFVD